MRQYLKIMHHPPKRRSVSAPYKGKTLAQLMAMDIPDENKLGASTLGQAFTYIRGFVSWLEEERLPDHQLHGQPCGDNQPGVDAVLAEPRQGRLGPLLGRQAPEPEASMYGPACW